MKDLFLKTRTAEFSPRPNEVLLGEQGNVLFVVAPDEKIAQGLAETLEDYFKIEGMKSLVGSGRVIKLNSKGLNGQDLNKAGFDNIVEAKAILKAAVKNWLIRNNLYKGLSKNNTHKNIYCVVELAGFNTPAPVVEETVTETPAQQPVDQFAKLTAGVQIRGLVKLRAMLEAEQENADKTELENELAERALRTRKRSEVPSME
jgi:hypothetical protein